jgi:two-component system CheB/CheR fusion protein
VSDRANGDGKAGTARRGASVRPAAKPASKSASESATRAGAASVAVAPTPDPEGPETPLIVGIGASAGGLNAFKAFFANMPADSGMAFVLIQHLDPTFNSILSDLLSRQTQMPVIDAADGAAVAANTVYVIPPDATLTIEDGVLHVERPAPPRQRRFPIDTFFCSLAEDQGENAVCIVLSGTGSDGTIGLKMIKAQGGLTLAQSEYDHLAMPGMPQSAAATGLVDHVMHVEEMPAHLIEYRRHLLDVAGRKDDHGSRRDTARHLSTIVALLRSGLGHDFGRYKENTLVRRIQRRMQVLQIDDTPVYIERLRKEPQELELLFQELLISVTRFFRDPPAFDALEAEVLPALLAGKSTADQVRIWVAGCATGEEVYSIAILLKEAMERLGTAPKVQIFGTDIDENAVAIARAGHYAKTMDGLSRERIARWFVEDGDGYRTIKPIREMCVFSAHSVVKDPPFSKLDLISCRNLMIYLDPELQERVVRTFHYALRAGGYLFLGSSEGVTRSAQLFAPVDAKHRLFQRSETVTPTRLPDFGSAAEPRLQPPRSVTSPFIPVEDRIEKSARGVLERHSPAYLVINRSHEIVRFSGGQTGRYLEPSAGTATFGLFAMLKKSLRPAVRAAVDKAFATGESAEPETVRIKAEGHERLVSVIVEPLADAAHPGGLCVVAFQDQGFVGKRGKIKASSDLPGATLQGLEHELLRTREMLQAAIDETEVAHQENSLSAEEYQAVNEEMQSSNEELETAKEEMQSINEELQTVNAELSSKNDQLTRLNSDMQNLIESTEIATVFLDKAMRIKSFTPAITGVFHLRDGDHGRPITEIVSRLTYGGLRADVETVLRDLSVVEHEVEIAGADTTFLMRIRPYRTVDQVVDGVVITFVDITERQRTKTKLREHAALVEFAQDALIGVSPNGAVRSWNPGAERLFGCDAGQAIGRAFSGLIPSDVDERTAALVDGALHGETGAPVEMIYHRRGGASVDIELIVAPIRSAEGAIIAVAVTARDISDRKIAEAHRTLLLHELSHRVKNALATVQSLAMETMRTAVSQEAFKEAFEARLIALSSTHDLLTRGAWHGATLNDVIEAELTPYQAVDHARWTATGPDLRLTPKMALALGMAFHELATNAAKYGALSTPGGRVAVDWSVTGHDPKPGDADSAGRRLSLSWVESAGPPVAKPERKGFGSRLIADALAFELDGEVEINYGREGVRCTVDAPLAPVGPEA